MTKKARDLIKKMFERLGELLGEDDAGLVLAILCDLLESFVKGVDQRELRTLTITLNDFHSIKYDFGKEEATVIV